MSNSKKQTAVEWLIDKLEKHYVHHDLKNTVVFTQAKAMEKEQHIEAYSNGWHDGQDKIIDQCKHIDKGGDDAGEQYYNETYN